jgi:hypothetical protein
MLRSVPALMPEGEGMRISNDHAFRRLHAAVLIVACLLPGCILIRTTEHRIVINEDGSGEAVLRLIDLRSDETQDSLIIRDFDVMVSSYENEGIADFEKGGRKVTGKQFFLRGDTLVAEIRYTFPSLAAVEVLRLAPQEIYVVVNQEREVVRTNGTIESWQDSQQRIRWPRDARRIFYQIREKTIPPSVSLAALYQKRYR